MEQTILLKLPDAQSPGFFRFVRGYAVFVDVMTKPLGHSVSEIDEAREWLVSLVQKPEKEKARKLILDLSSEEIAKLIEQMGESATVTPDPLSSGPSEDG